MKTIAVILLLMSLAASGRAQTEFSQDSALRVLRHLSVEIGPRPMGSPAEQRALEYAVERFKSAGCDTAYIMAMDHSSRAITTSGIAVGVKRGATHRIIVVGGHIDSAGPEIPGADDDGSGSATVIELARVLGHRATQSTIVFCCFGGEEQGLEGSEYFVSHFPDLDSVALMLQVDMANGDGLIALDPDTHGRSAPRWLVEALVKDFDQLGYKHLDYPTHFCSINYAAPAGAGSDHEPFLNAGIPAIDLTTDVSKPIHTPRDNFENFEPAGLQRSGSVMLRLIEQFDGGVPQERTGQYWLMLIGFTPVFLPLWAVWALGILSIAVAVWAFIAVRRRRVVAPVRIRWSGLKLWLFGLIIAGAGWLSSDVVGLVEGLRFPWYAHPSSYYLLAGIGCVIGGWIAAWLSTAFKLTQCPYVLFKRSAIILVLFLFGGSLFTTKLIMEPAAALFLLSLAILVRPWPLKILLAALSPWWMLRIVFSEWSDLFMREIARGLPPGIAVWLAFNTFMILFFSVFILPLLFGIAAVVRDSAGLKRFLPLLRSRWLLALLLLLFVLDVWHLTTIPAYDRLWYRAVNADARYDLDSLKKEVDVTCREYLTGLTISDHGKDTTFNAHATSLTIFPAAGFDTTLARVERTVEKLPSGDSAIYHVELTVHASRRPYTVVVRYSTGDGPPSGFTTPLYYYTGRRQVASIQWYSYPDTLLTIPVSFTVPAGKKMKEELEVTFDGLAYPIDIRGPLAYVIPRTHVVASREYGS